MRTRPMKIRLPPKRELENANRDVHFIFRPEGTMYSLTLLIVVLVMTTSRGEESNLRRRAQQSSTGLTAGVVTCPSKNLFLADIQGAAITNFNVPTIAIDPSQTFQSVDGFGFTLTGGSAKHLMEMNPEPRTRLLQEIFGNIKSSVVRISVGASDLDPDPYSLDDVWNDVALDRFSMDREMQYKIPILGEILSINPDVRLLATPWSAPYWMKDNQYTSGGSLMRNMYEVYARYLVKYLLAMKNEGLPVYYLSIQNEPLNGYNNPSMSMSSNDQAVFIKDYLAPAISSAGLTTKLILYDHNLDRPDYPISLLDDPVVKSVVAGSAFHMYAGTIDVMTTVHNRHPDKDVYFTEQYTSPDGQFEGDLMWHARHVWIGGLKNWAKIVMEWNLSSNPTLTPYTPGGCTNCLGAVTIDGNSVQKRNIAYYLTAHVSSYIPRGSVRVGSNLSGGNNGAYIDHVAFKTPSGTTVVFLANQYWDDSPIILFGRQFILPKQSVVTLAF